ncbi:MAG TPA: ThuA domain-containing protein, partial [Planctomycetaceae bacterium]|nr:ThuA domain-containing protein [Planctomycetaceae bacterium]
MPARCCYWLSLVLLCLACADSFAQAEEVRPRKIVLIAGKKSHGPVGNGIHDYPWSVNLLKVMLDNSNIADRVRVECHFEGWPEDAKTLDDADTIMVISDGRDGDQYEEAPPFQSEEKLQAIEKQIRRGCGFVTFHFSTFAPDKYADRILNWTGGYFDWETDGKRQWYSAITTKDAEVQLGSPDHPVSRGLTPFKMKEEFYYNIRFDPNDKALRPIWIVPDLPGREPDGRVVAWARERADGGRGFGTTCGHFYENWQHENFRRAILNALAWTAKVGVPAGGVTARYYTHAEITAALAGKTGTARAVVDDRPIRALILTGHQYPGHKWKDTTPVIQADLARDPRMQVDVSEKIEDLASENLSRYDVLVLNYCNWESPGLSEAAKAGFVKYLSQGGGLCVVHFANGAFHFSLPKAGDSDWPEFRKICRRVWDHTSGKSGHDAYGKFTVEIENPEHPITRGLEAFETTDELYFRQQGDEPIDVVAKAKSQITGQWEPMAFVYPYGKGRVFQTVLGHSAESLQTPGTAALLRRGAAWAAGREPAEDAILNAAAAPAPAEGPVQGKFGKGWNARKGGLFVDGKPEYREAPLTVECWARLNDRQPYNILVAHELKISGTHWELFSMAGNGRYTAYTPGLEPDHVHSTVDLCDDRWHYVAMAYEPERIRLFVDGKQVAEQAVKSRGQKAVPGGLGFGSLFGREIGCQGIIDEIRISRGIRPVDRVPEGPFQIDEQTVGLWHLDSADEKGAFADESRLKNPARPTPPQVSAAKPKIEGHWGEDAIGFRWTEQDSVDNRWNETKIGRWLASNLPIPNQPMVGKGLSIRVGDEQQGAVCFDTETMTLRAAWTGGFLKFDPARFGLIAAPKPAGDLLFAASPGTGWRAERLQYRGLTPHRERVVLHSMVDGAEVRESPWIEERDGIAAITRTIELSAHSNRLALVVLSGAKPAVVTEAGRRIARIEERGKPVAVALVGADEAELAIDEKSSSVVLHLPASGKPVGLKLLMWSGVADRWPGFAKLAADSPAPQSLAPLTEPSRPHWRDVLTTQGVRGKDNGPYVIDTLTIPFANPYGALMFTSGHDFFENGNCAVC